MEEEIINPFNPLEVPLILCRVFSFLPMEDKRTFRMVCKFWRNETLVFWRKTSSFTMMDTKAIDDKTDSDDNPNLVLPQIYKMDVEEKRFRHFKIQTVNTIFPPYETNDRSRPIFYNNSSSRIVHPFIETYGPSMESLHLGAKFREGRLKEALKWILLRNCQNVKKLSIATYVLVDQQLNQIIFGEGGSDDEEYPEYAENLESLSIDFTNKYASTTEDELKTPQEVFSFLPNLKILKLSGFKLDRVMAAIPLSTTKNGQFLKLEELQIDFQLVNMYEIAKNMFRSLKQYVKQAAPPLRKLKFINLLGGLIRDAPFYWFHQIIWDLRRSLTHLHLQMKFLASGGPFQNCRWMSDLSVINFPNLTHLVLNIGLESEWGGWLPPRLDFNALRKMPKLKVLRCLAYRETVAAVDVSGESFLMEHNLEYGGPIMDWMRAIFGLEKKAGYSSSSLPSSSKMGRVEVEVEAEFFEGPLTVFPELEEFSFFFYERLTEGSLRVLGNLFPNVKKLGLALDKNTFPVVFQVWEKLEKVVLLEPLGIEKEQMEAMELSRNVRIEVIDNEECYRRYTEDTF